jgi:ArsR family transcriptional regulator, arsenate/arsenite/antimonite-responsive transcriptional repressor
MSMGTLCGTFRVLCNLHFDCSGIVLDSRGTDWHFDLYRNEEPPVKASSAIEALGALAQEHRLALFRLLVQAGEKGMPAGMIAEKLGVPNSSLSFHLTQLRKAGLILQERQHRSLIYRANYEAMKRLVAYLMENCCAGADCAPAAACETRATTRKSA